MNSTLKYMLFTFMFISLGTASYTLGQETAQNVSPVYSHTYEYQTTSFDPIGDKNEEILGQKDNLELKNTIIKVTYLPTTDSTISRQNKRELCAYNSRITNKQWVDFVNLINQKCNYDNIDVCWQTQAINSNYNPENIIECFSSN